MDETDSAGSKTAREFKRVSFEDDGSFFIGDVFFEFFYMLMSSDYVGLCLFGRLNGTVGCRFF